jgi:hypothetical protein
MSGGNHSDLLSEHLVPRTFLTLAGVTLSCKGISEDTCPWYLGKTWIQFGCGKDNLVPGPSLVHAGPIGSWWLPGICWSCDFVSDRWGAIVSLFDYLFFLTGTVVGRPKVPPSTGIECYVEWSLPTLLNKWLTQQDAEEIVFTSVKVAFQAVASLHRQNVGGASWARQFGGLMLLLDMLQERQRISRVVLDHKKL